MQTARGRASILRVRARARDTRGLPFRMQRTQLTYTARQQQQTETPLDLCTQIVYNTLGNFNCR